MRSRNTLHIRHLADFQAFCENEGWVKQANVGDYEVLRMTHPGKPGALLVHTRHDAKEHYTTSGQSNHLAGSFYRARRRAPVAKLEA